MRANTLNMHYTLAHPEEYGIKSYEPTLSRFSPESIPLTQKSLAEKIELLENIRPENLSSKDANLRNLLIRSLRNSAALNSFPYYSEPLSSTSGMQTQLPILLAEYSFRSKRDVEDYLALLDQTDEYFASLLIFEQEKAAAGLMMPASFLRETREQCYTIISEDSLSDSNHFLQTTFQSRLDELVYKEQLTLEEADAYTARHNELLRTVLLPAYRSLGDSLLPLEDSSIVPRGLGGYPDGKYYYEQLLISETGSYRPIAEIREMLVTRFEQDAQAIRRIVSENPMLLRGEPPAEDFPLHKASDILLDLQKRMMNDFPKLPEGKTSITLKTVVPEMEDYCAPAFYMTPPLDDTDANTIYINQQKTPDGLELYTTLAHEGFPGHLYQNVYHNRLSTINRENPVRQILWYGGYLEGWAIYGEMISYDYASDLLQEAGLEDYARQVTLEKHNRSLQLCLYSLLDIMIHYENASFAEVYEWLAAMGVGSPDTVKKVYNYILQEPCNYLKYYLGYLEILSLRDDAKQLWGSAYTDYDFHCYFLNCGPSDFASLREQLPDSP